VHVFGITLSTMTELIRKAVNKNTTPDRLRDHFEIFTLVSIFIFALIGVNPS